MDFEYTWKLLHLLWIVPLFGILVYTAAYKRKKVLEQIFGINATFSTNSTLSPGRRYLRLWLLLGAIVLLCVAIARPRWGWRILPFSDRGRDLMIVLDVSKSMRSEDIRPTRLKHAKLFIRNLIKSNPGDRFGLIAFAGSAFLECPLTVDKTSIFQTLDEINTDSIPLGGTNIENALDTALLAFQAAEGGYRAIVLISDGDELSGDSSKALATLKSQKIPLFVVGIGKPSGDGLIKMTGPDGKTHLLRDSQGKLVKSKLNEVQLKKLSTATGGIYVRSTASEPELAAIDKRVQELVPKEYSKGSSKRPIEKFHYPLCAAVLLLLIRFGIGERRRDVTLALFFAMIIMTGLSPTAHAQNKPLPKVEKQLALEDGVEGEKITTGKKSEAETPAVLYNRALKLHMEHKSEEASKLYKKAVNMSKVAPEVRSKAFQNLGVINHEKARALMQKDPDKALKIMDYAEVMYKEAMRSDIKRKRVVLNQQKLIDDRKLAKQIKNKKEELKKKQQQAQKKTKEAHDQQKKENQNKNKQKKKEKNKQQQNQKQDKSQEQQKKSQGSDNKEEPREKKDGGGSGNKDKENTEKKIQDAKKACSDLKDAAKRHQRPDIKKQAEEAEKELKKAEEEHKKGDGKKSEEHLKKALEKLKSNGKEQNNKDKQQQKKGDEGQNKDQNKKKNDKKGDQKQAGGDRKLEKQKPQSDKKGEQKAQEEVKEKPIDPRQAATLLDMMANDEKTLRDKIKENQKRNSRVKKVLKDW